MISIWFFVGVSLLVNGLLIFGAGLYELSHRPEHPVVLYSMHASAWWGALLTIVGAIYSIVYRPRKGQS